MSVALEALEILGGCFVLALGICAPMLLAEHFDKRALKKFRESVRCPHCKGTGVKA